MVKMVTTAGIFLCMRPANERQCYIVTAGLIHKTIPATGVVDSPMWRLTRKKTFSCYDLIMQGHQAGLSII